MASFPTACVVVLAAACAGGTRNLETDRASDEARAQRSALTVLEGDQLDAAIQSGASIPQILSSRVPSLRFVRNPPLTTNCPVFVLRGNSSITQISEPDYYVDSSRANDSCILLSLSARELRAIEVYSAGASPVGMALRSNTGGTVVLRTRIR
jgi:hypothetical protein